jgi:hypothetical protein
MEGYVFPRGSTVLFDPPCMRNFIFLVSNPIGGLQTTKEHQGQLYLRNSNSKCLKSFLDNANKKPRE